MEIDNNEIENVEREIQLQTMETERQRRRHIRGSNGELVKSYAELNGNRRQTRSSRRTDIFRENNANEAERFSLEFDT